jgi:hypothetical protein
MGGKKTGEGYHGEMSGTIVFPFRMSKHKLFTPFFADVRKGPFTFVFTRDQMEAKKNRRPEKGI